MDDPSRQLLARLVEDDPFAFDSSEEGFCFFCGASMRHATRPYREYAAHKPDCAWFEARTLLGIDLGDHIVEPVVIDVAPAAPG